MSTTPGGDSRRRAEIEAKRAKLAELKRAREERSSRLLANRTPVAGTSEVGTPASTSSSTRKDIDDLVATLTRTPRASTSATGGDDSPSRRGTAGGLHQRPGSSSDFGGSDGLRPSSTTFKTDEEVATAQQQQQQQQGRSFAPAPDLVDVQTELFEFPQKERVYYTKEVQTMATGTDEDDDGDAKGAGVGADAQTNAATEAAIRKRILAEQAEAQEKDRQLKREEEDLERQIQEELRIMSPEEVAAVFGTTDFSEFVETSSKIVERALTDAYDYMKDYTIAGASAGDEAGTATRDEVKLARCFYDDKMCKGRSVTAIDWSAKHPELVVVSYSRSSAIAAAADSSPDGLVLVWNLHLLDRPEFVFQAQTDVLSVCFSPFHPHLVVGGTYSGQILIWDTRAKNRGGVNGGILPSLKTPLSSLSGHTHPVYSLSIVGTQNAHHLITASTDGLICSWMLPDMLARPVDSLQLLNQAHPKTDEVSVTSVGFMQQGRVETNAFWMGTEEGSLWMAARFDRAGAKAGLQAGVEGAHAAPVTALDFHRASSREGGAAGMSGPGSDFSDLLLTSSMDWTAKLWRVSLGGSTSSSTANNSSRSAASTAAPPTVTPLLTFDDYSDYVLCAQWHPTHPSLFATADASGVLHVHDLARDVERPVAQVRFDGSGGVVAAAASTGAASPMGLNKLAWDKASEPRKLACGGTDGRVYVLDVGGLATVGGAGEEWVEMGRLVSRAASGAGGAGAAVTNGVGGGGRFGAVGR